MKHRHLVDGVGYTPASVEDILERGSPDDWIDLRNAVLTAPHGAVTRTVLDVCRSTKMYGTSALWMAFVETIRREAGRST